MELKKLPPATVLNLVNALRAIGIQVNVLDNKHATFKEGFIGHPNGAKMPLVALDFRTTDEQTKNIREAFHGLGSWSLLNERFFLKPTIDGFEIKTIEYAIARGVV
jgi:hypothetical protein